MVAIACGLPDSGTGILDSLCFCYPHAIAHPEAKRNQIAKEVRDVLISILVGHDKGGNSLSTDVLGRDEVSDNSYIYMFLGGHTDTI